MDDLLATLQMTDLDKAATEREKLRALFQDDPMYWRVQFSDDRFAQSSVNAFFQRQASPSGGCSGGRHGLMRCSREIGRLFDKETLQYGRSTLLSDDRHLLRLEFDYDLLLDRYPAAPEYVLDAATLRKQDGQFLGSWQLMRTSHRGDGGPRKEIVSLEVGPRLDHGQYAVDATVQMVTLDDSNPPTDCMEPKDRCKWFGTSAGTLAVRGSRVLISYDARGWFDDRLQVTSTGLVGTDPWRDVVRFRHVNAGPSD